VCVCVCGCAHVCVSIHKLCCAIAGVVDLVRVQCEGVNAGLTPIVSLVPWCPIVVTLLSKWFYIVVTLLLHCSLVPWAPNSVRVSVRVCMLVVMLIG
jgi:hypothetical protein